jgi:hypothetical protein
MKTPFEQAPFEKDLQIFSKEIKEHQIKNNIENLKEVHVKDFLKSKIGDSLNADQPGVSAQTSTIDEARAFPDYLIKEPMQVKTKVEQLINMAFSEGIEKSAKEAAKAGPFILDAFHDALTSKLYEELKKRGMIK